MNYLKLVLFAFIIILLNACSKDAAVVTPVILPIDSTNIGLSDNFKTDKSGIFTGQGGYPVSGTAELGKNIANKSVVHLTKDFNTAIHTGSVTLYLSKNKSLKINDATSYIRFGTTSVIGEQYFGLSEQPTDDYKFIIVWCAPAGVQFGSADLN
jgi:Electron transfer DM13